MYTYLYINKYFFVANKILTNEASEEKATN